MASSSNGKDYYCALNDAFKSSARDPTPLKKKAISKAKTVLITLFITSILTRYKIFYSVKIIKMDRNKYSKTEWKRIKFKYWILKSDRSKLVLK